jgi:hypothetical protein
MSSCCDGSINGAKAQYYFNLDTTTYYILYSYQASTSGMTANAYYLVDRFGETFHADSGRFDLNACSYELDKFRMIQSDFYQASWGRSTLHASSGSWYPIGIYRFSSGKKVVTFTLGADTLTPPCLSADAIRLLRSDHINTPDLEFGRRFEPFDSVWLYMPDSSIKVVSGRVGEGFGDQSLGIKYTKDVRLFNNGGAPLVVSGFSFTAFPGGRFRVLTPAPITIGPGTSRTITMEFQPFQEETARDTLLIESNDPEEPLAAMPLYGTGVNYNFIMNASDGTEPHFNAPPRKATDPLYYEEFPAGNTFSNSLPSKIPFPIPGGNIRSRVWVFPFPIPTPETVTYAFTVPVEKTGAYILEYSGPSTSNGDPSLNVEVTTAFKPDTARVFGFNEWIGFSPAEYLKWYQFGGTTAFQLNGGAPSTVKMIAHTNLNVGQLLRADLLRVRKVPTAPTISFQGTGLATGVDVGNVSIYNDERLKQGNFRRTFSIGSNGESLIQIDTMYVRQGKYFKLTDLPSRWPLQLPAVNGLRTFTVEFTPDRIATGFTDTVTVKSNANNIPVLNIIVTGNGVGTVIVADDIDQETFILPPYPVPYVSPMNVTSIIYWQKISGEGYGPAGAEDRLILPIYYSSPANGYLEWFPNIPLKPGTTAAASDSFDVYVTSPTSSLNSSPAARYIIYHGGKRDTVVANQNSLLTTTTIGNTAYGAISLGRYLFLRGGKDAHGSTGIFGYVRVENDTALVSKYYNDLNLANAARRDTMFLRADALVMKEVAKIVGVESVEALPVQYELSQNYPNPFNPETQIKFALPMDSKVELKIFDILGREVLTLVNEQKNAGRHLVLWNGRNGLNKNVASGVYFYRLNAKAVGGGAEFIQSKKMVLLR